MILGYLKDFPSELVGAWSSGTGAAGVGGSGLYLGFRMWLLIPPFLKNYFSFKIRFFSLFFLFEIKCCEK